MRKEWNGGRMINITYKSREPPSLTVCGHSGYSTKGRDIVCAAVSALFMTLVNSLNEYTDDLITVRSEPGDGAITWSGMVSERAQLLLLGTLLGLELLSKEYPDHISYNIV